MTTSPSVKVHDPYWNQDYQQASHEKARALGYQLASRVLPVLDDTNAVFTNQYGASHAPYGEINFVGPEAAGRVHAALKELCTKINSPTR